MRRVRCQTDRLRVSGRHHSARRCEPEIIRPLCWSGWRAARQAHCKDRAFARLARHRHVATHHARELAGDGKPEPRAAEVLRGRPISLGELLEQLSLLLRSHADPCVRDRELDPVATVDDPACPQLDLTFLGELAGIAQQVEQYLPQPHGVHTRAVRPTSVLRPGFIKTCPTYSTNSGANPKYAARR